MLPLIVLLQHFLPGEQWRQVIGRNSFAALRILLIIT